MQKGSTSRIYVPQTGKNIIQSVGTWNYTANPTGQITYAPSSDKTFTYDPFTQMPMQSVSVYQTLKFQYDANKERVYKEDSNPGGTTKTLYLHGMNDFPLMQKESNGTDRYFIYGPGGLLAVMVNGTTYYVMKDHLGSTRVMVNSTGSAVARYDYDPYGELFASSVNTDAKYLFTRQEGESGYHNFRARFYDSKIGLFYSFDPAHQTTSPFSYCGNNPVVSVDKDGRLAWFVIPIIVGIISGGVNVAAHWDQIKKNGGWEFAKAFGIGFGAGFIGTCTGASVLAAASGTTTLGVLSGSVAIGSGGFWGAGVSGLADYMTQTSLSIMGNTTVFGDPLPTPRQMWLGAGLSFFGAGLMNGTLAAASGRNFWNGNLLSTSADATSVASSALPNGLSDPETAENYAKANNLGNVQNFDGDGNGSILVNKNPSEKIVGNVIKGFKDHAVQQAITRGFKPADILKIVREGSVTQAMGRYGPQLK